MRMTWYEMKKALLSPIVLVLILGCIGLNTFQIISQSHAKDEINLVNELIDTYGLTITADSLAQLNQDLDDEAARLGGTDGVREYLNNMTYEIYNELSADDRQSVDRLSTLSMYESLGTSLEERYASVNMDELRKDLYTGLDKDSSFSNFMEQEFNGWEKRYEEIIATNEYKQWFFAGDYRIHSEMYRTLLKNIAIQSVLIVALMTALIANYEVDQRTQQVLYTTKKGRLLMRHKFSASLVLASLTFFILITAAFGLYFIIYDFSGVWNSVVSSGLNWEYKLPYITWWELTIWQYFLLAVGIEWVVVVIVSMLTFTISFYVKNSYFTWIICMALLIGVFLYPELFNAFPFLKFLATLNLTLLLLNPHMYFSGGTSLTMVQYFELWSLLIWAVIAVIVSLVSYQRFLKKDVS